MIDRYTKALLTVIAVCLAVLVVQNAGLAKPAQAQQGGPTHVVIDQVASYAFQFAGPLQVKQ